MARFFRQRDDDVNLDENELRDVEGKPQVKIIEIKLAQGARPGKGGILPASRIGREISEIRAIPEGEDSISPNRHAEVGGWQDLLDFIALIRDITGLPTGIMTGMGSDRLRRLL